MIYASGVKKILEKKHMFGTLVSGKRIGKPYVDAYAPCSDNVIYNIRHIFCIH